VITPSDLPPGFLTPETVTLARGVDGDTAHFIFPSSGEQIARFLFVNTEESYGDMATAFGQMSKEMIIGYLEAATEIVVAVREDRIAGMPDLDPYDRWLSLIFVDGELFETRIVREGWSAYYTQFGCAPGMVHQALLYAEAEANAAQLGIWEPGHPTDYDAVLTGWIGNQTCRPNPYREPYCR
jgi:endonuclease YncB( thermonuclease family)